MNYLNESQTRVSAGYEKIKQAMEWFKTIRDISYKLLTQSPVYAE